MTDTSREEPFNKFDAALAILEDAFSRMDEWEVTTEDDKPESQQGPKEEE